MSYRTFVLGISLLFISASALAAGLSISADIAPAKTLPGIPVSVQMTVSNETEVLQSLPSRFIVEVIGSTSGPFLATGGLRGFYVSALPDVYLESLDLGPGERKTFQVPLGESLAFPGYLSDPQLLTPGTYRLRLIFADTLKDDELHAVGFFDRATKAFSESPEIVLQIEAPEGEDAEVLERLREEFNVRSLGSLSPTRKLKFAKTYSSRFPNSRYTPWLASLAPTESLPESFEKATRVLEMKPEPLLADRLRLSRAQIQHQLGVQARFDGREKAAAEHFGLAKLLTVEARTHAQTPLGRLQAIQLDQKIERAQAEAN